MNRDVNKEEEFYAKKFNWSYSSLNKLLFSPTLFYKDYILQDREVKTDKHLIEGKAIHCLLFEPDNFNSKFNVVPGKSPSDSVRKVLKNMSLHTDEEKLSDVEDFIILDSLKEMNLYQSLKADEARIAKIRNEDNTPYWKFLSNPAVDVIDQDTLQKCKESVDQLKDNTSVMSMFENNQTDFDLDPIESYAEKYLVSELDGYPFGLHGYIDHYVIDHETKIVTISDLKTTGKTVADFRDTVDFYNYWLQAAIYCKLVYDSLGDDADEYKIVFKFVVIDVYKQVYVFEVSDESLSAWASGLSGALKTAKHHYDTRNYTLPYEFLVNKIKL
jgi:hypothetical protein